MMDFVIAKIAESNRRWVSEQVNDITDKMMFDVMQKRAKMAITHSNAKLEQKWRDHVKDTECTKKQ